METAVPGSPSPTARGDGRTLLLHDATDTRALGRRLAALLRPCCGRERAPLLLLRGDLGAGKTCLVQGVAEELGIAEPITSPSFALAQHYDGHRDGVGTALVHLDLYRLEEACSADELFAQEEEEARALGALMAVEWPGRLSLPPQDAWWVELRLRDPDRPEAGRLARISASPEGPAWPSTPEPER